MSIKFTRRGYIEVLRGGQKLSQHTQEREAIESISRLGDGDYVIRYPEVAVRVIGSVANQAGGDTEAPTVPQNVIATAVDKNQIDASWDASTDNVGVTGYHVFANGIPQPDVSTGTSASITGLTPSTLYSITVAAFDASGNTSAASDAATATTPANSAPVWTAIDDQDVIVGDAFNLDLSGYVTDADTEDTLTYSVASGTLPSGLSLSGSIVSGTPTTAGQAPTIVFRVDDGNDTADETVNFTSWTADVTAPPVPTGLAATASSSSQIDVSWSASVDASGGTDEYVSGTQDYRLYRDGALRTTLTGTSYGDTGLSAATSYSYTVSARDVELNESAQSSASSATTQSSAANDSDADWAIASAAAGVVWSVPFSQASNVDDYRFNGAFDPTSSVAGSTRLQYRASEGFRSGSGAMRIEDTTTGNNGVVWQKNFNPAYTSGNLTNDLVIGAGEPMHFRVAIKMNQARLDGFGAGGGSGCKIFSFSTASDSNTEQETFLMRNAGRYYTSVSDSNSTQIWYYRDLGNGDYDMQPGSEYGTCLYSNDSPPNGGCFYIPGDEWVVYHYTLIPGTPGSSATPTTIRVEKWQTGESQYTTIYFRKDLVVDNWDLDPGISGYSGAYLWNRAENHGTQAAGQYHYFSDAIFSRAPIAAPKETFSAPTYASAATSKRWGVIPGTTTGTIDAAWPEYPGTNLLTYGGGAVSQRDGKFSMAPGGHAINTQNAIVTLDYMQNSCSWSKEMTGVGLTTGDFSTNGTGAFSDGSRVHDHTYNSIWYADNGALYFPGMNSAYSPSGSGTFVSTACWKWDSADISNGRQGYTALGRASASYPWGETMVNASGCYDPARRHVWYVGQQGYNGSGAMLWYIDTNDDTLSGLQTGWSQFATFPAWATIVPRLNVMLVQLTNGTLKRMDLGTRAWTTCTVANGSLAPTSTTESAHYVNRADQVIGRRQGDGANVRVLSLPATASGVYTWALRSPVSGGSTPDEAFEVQGGSGEYHQYTKFNVVQDIGNGNSMLIFAPTKTSATYFYIVDGAL